MKGRTNTRRVRYDGRNGRLLVYGLDIPAGGVAEVTQQQADELMAHPHIPVSILGVVTHRSEDATKREE